MWDLSPRSASSLKELAGIEEVQVLIGGPAPEHRQEEEVSMAKEAERYVCEKCKQETMIVKAGVLHSAVLRPQDEGQGLTF